MSPEKEPFGFRDLVDILVVNAKVIFAIILFLLVFLGLAYGYYSFLLIGLAIIIIVFFIFETIREHHQN